MINRKERLLRAVENGFHSISEGAAPVLDECRIGCAEDYTIYGRTQVGKNLLKYPYYSTTKTTNGITFTDNGDGTVTANGTATANAYFYIQGVATNTPLEKGKYWLSGCPEGGSELTYYLNAANKNDTGSGIAITPNGTLPYACTIIIKTGVVCESLVFRPQLEKGEAATEYEPYTEEKVGDRTRNIVPPVESGIYYSGSISSGYPFIVNTFPKISSTENVDVYIRRGIYAIKKLEEGKTYTLSFKNIVNNCATKKITFTAGFRSSEEKIFGMDEYTNCVYSKSVNPEYFTFTVPSGFPYCIIGLYNYPTAEGDTVSFDGMQLEEGESATDYEPYGYRIPVSVNGENSANIYLAAPLGSGESVSFSDDNLPELPLASGTNTVTAETEIPPQKISVEYISKVKKY